MRKSIKKKEGGNHNELESPVKKLFKELFHHSHTSFAKGSVVSTPRGTVGKKEAFKSYLNVKNVNLDKTYYFRKVLNSQRFVTSDKNPSVFENCIE